MRFQSSLRAEGSYLPCPVSLRRMEQHCQIISHCALRFRRQSFIASFESILRERHLIYAKLRLQSAMEKRKAILKVFTGPRHLRIICKRKTSAIVSSIAI